MRFDVKLPQLYNGHARGIYLREPYQTEDPSVFKVYLEPSYKEDTSVLEKQTFTCSLSLKSTATWLQAASHYHFANGRGFEVRVDSSGMKPGHYFAEVEAYDTTAPFTAGALLRIPVTVVIPQYLPPLAPSPSFSFGVLSFRPGQLHRKYVKVPIGATWVDFNIRAGNTWGGGDSGSNRRLNVIHCQQLLGELAHRNSMLDKYFWMQAGSAKVFSMAVRAGGTLECVFGQFWSSLGDGSVEVSMEFHGVTPSDASPALAAGTRVKRFDVMAQLTSEICKPSAKLTRHVSMHRPTSAVLAAGLIGRDELPKGRHTFTMTLTYSFKLEEACKVSLHPSPLDELLYDSPLESQLIIVFDACKRVLGYSDAWPSRQYLLSLPKGDITVKLQLRHHKKSLLESLSASPLSVKRNLKKEISVSAYWNLASVIKGNAIKSGRALKKGETVPVFIAVPDVSKMPPGYDNGSKVGVTNSLEGSITWVERGKSLPGASSRPSGYPLSLSLLPVKPKDFKVIAGVKKDTKKSASTTDTEKNDTTEKTEKTGSKESKTPKEKDDSLTPLEVAIRDAKISYLSKLVGTEEDKEVEAKLLIADLAVSSSKHLPYFDALLTRALSRAEKVESSSDKDTTVVVVAKPDDESSKLNYVDSRRAVADAALAVSNAVENPIALAAYFGKKIKKDDEKSTEKHKKMVKKKETLVKALAARATALGEILLCASNVTTTVSMEDSSDSDNTNTEFEFQYACEQLEEWVALDGKDSKHLTLSTIRHRVMRRPASAISCILAQIKTLDDAGVGNVKRKVLYEDLIKLCHELGWSHWETYHKSWQLIRFPKSYPLM